MRTTGFLIMVAGAALLCGCGATAPSELTGARAAYERASAGPAARLSPEELHKAQTALNKAEAAFKEDADSYQTRDLAYVAQRRAEMAEASASIALQRNNATASNDDFNAAQGDILQERTLELRDARAALTSSEQAGQATSDELAAEQKAHLATEERMTEQGVLMQEKNQDLSRARTGLAVSEAVGQASVDQLAAEQNARLEAERRAATQGMVNQDRTPIVIQDRTPIVIQTPAPTAVAPAAQPAATPVAPVAAAQPTNEQLVAAEVARLEAARMSAEQARRLESSTQDLNQTRTALAVSEYAGQSSAEQLEAAQSAQRDAENRSTDQDRRMQQNAQDLSRAQSALAASEQAGQATADQLAVAEKARLAAEKTTAETQAELDALIATKDQRGEVFTLSGGLLFRSNESSLMPGAETQLQRLVKALAATADRNIVVEGYTDSQGSDDYNLDLSRRRAEAVRNYLVRSGYPADRILAEGIGESRPIADNSTSEGRANNRRVEIVLGPEAKP
ncbi:MAG: OmpA family protein [Candidatus Latescibacteria bacterium]|nr:OmpA family protein [Candidatus Latescibacterota bacterium]